MMFYKTILFVMAIFLLPFLVHADEEIDQQERAKLVDELVQMLSHHDFKKIEKRLTRYEKRLEHTKSGIPKINVTFFPIAEAIHKKRNSTSLLQEWRDQAPKSYYPDLAYVWGLDMDAWEQRGTGLSSTVSRRGWSNAQTYADEEIKILETMKFPNGNKPPLYYNLRMRAVVLSSSSDKKADMLSILDEAINQHPKYLSPYYIVLAKLQTRWYGEPGEIISFIEKYANALKGKKGDMLYTLLARDIADLDLYGGTKRRRFFSVDYFYKNPEINWSRMRKGYKSLISSYPSTWNINDFAWFACVAGDKETAKSLLKKVQANPVKDIWSGDQGYIAWTEWLKQIDYPSSANLKKNWKTTSKRNATIRVGKKYEDGFAPVEVTSSGNYFEGIAKVYADGSGTIKGRGYEKLAQQEVRGNFLASLGYQNRSVTGTYWKRNVSDHGEESIFVGRSETVNSVSYKAGLETLSAGSSPLSSYLGAYQNKKRTGLGRLINSESGFESMPEIYYGELIDGIFDGFGLLSGSKLFKGYTFVGTFKNGKPVGIGAIINLPIWRLPGLEKNNLKYIKCLADGSFEMLEKSTDSKFDFIHYKKGRKIEAYLGFVENHRPHGMGIKLVNSYNYFAIGKWGDRPEDALNDWIRLDLPDFEKYRSRRPFMKTLVRNKIVYQGKWGGPILKSGSIVFPDGRIITYK